MRMRTRWQCLELCLAAGVGLDTARARADTKAQRVSNHAGC